MQFSANRQSSNLTEVSLGSKDKQGFREIKITSNRLGYARKAAGNDDYLGPHFVDFKKATKSASSCLVICCSNPAGITDTVPGRISVMSARAIRTSASGPVASTISSAASFFNTPLYVSSDFVVTMNGS